MRPRSRQLHAHLVEAEALRRRAAGRSQTSTMSACSVSAAPPLAGSTVSVTPASAVSALVTLEPSLNFRPCLASARWKMLGDLVVDARRDAVEELDHRHLGAEATPHRAQLEADDAGADHDQALGHLGELERAGRGDDLLLVDRRRRAAASLPSPWRSGCSWPRACPSPRRRRRARRHVPAASMRPVPWNEAILFFLNRKATPLVVASTTSPLRFISWAKSSVGGCHHDAVRGEVVARFLEQVRGLQQRLGRDAADVEAGAAEASRASRRPPPSCRAGRRGSPPRSRRGRRRSRRDRRFVRHASPHVRGRHPCAS